MRDHAEQIFRECSKITSAFGGREWYSKTDTSYKKVHLYEKLQIRRDGGFENIEKTQTGILLRVNLAHVPNSLFSVLLG